MRSNDFFETNCVVCGKEICMANPDMWAYVTVYGKWSKKSYCCSWHCLQVAPHNNGKGKKAEKKDIIFKLLKEGKEDSEIASIANVTAGTVRYWKVRYIE